MTEINGLMDHGHPRSRDWALPNFKCKKVRCIINLNGRCMSPAVCEINEEGKCMGYKAREDLKDKLKKEDSRA